MDAAGLFLGADNTTLQPTLGSNFCIGPQNCVLKDRGGANVTAPRDHRTTAQLRAMIDDRSFGYAFRPSAGFHIMRLPVLSDNHSMHIEIFSTRTDVEPISRSEERRVGKECRSRWSLEH